MDKVLFIIITIFVFITSLCFGSFLNVVIYRLPNKMSLIKPPSHCTTCNKPIIWYDNIPILSYLILKGRCRYCHSKISIRYPIVEALTAILSTLIFLYYKLQWISLFTILLLFCFIAIEEIDREHYIIPDSLVITIAIIAIMETIVYKDGVYGYDNYISKLIMLGISIIFALVILLIEKISKREIMGGGDLKLIAAAGIFLGYQQTLLAIGIASIIGVIVELGFKKLLKREKDQKGSTILPFGPYLVVGFLISLLFSHYLFSWYLSLF